MPLERNASPTGRPLRILIVGDAAARAAILEDGVREAHTDAADVTVVHAGGPAGLLPRIAAADPDVILLDLGDPDRDLLEATLQVSRQVRRPIAIFVDQSDSAAAQAAMDAGVSAYIVDGLRKERVKAILDVTISRFRALDRLRSELDAAKAALEDRKIIDQAKAILMRQRDLSEEDAYRLLRRTAMSQNRKVGELARSLVAAAMLLDGGT
jgi:response regulator NasT